MADVEIKVNPKELKGVADKIDKARFQLIARLAVVGADFMREEAPVRTSRLLQGIAPTKVDRQTGTATITATAKRASLTAGTGQVFSRGKPTGKIVSLKPQPEFNYAESVAKGRKAITTKGKALLIPINGTPTGNYVRIGRQNFIYARRARAVAANPFHLRAAARLEKAAPVLADEVLRKFFK